MSRSNSAAAHAGRGTTLKWAFNSATVMKLTWDEEFVMWEKYGWKAVEPWYDKLRPPLDAGRTCRQLGQQMRDAGIVPVGLAPSVLATPSSNVDTEKQTGELSRRLDAAADLGAPALTLVILGDVGADLAAEYDRLIDPLCRVADMAQERRLRVNLEFLGGNPINGTLGSGIELVRRVDHPALGLLLDLCHYYVSASHVEEITLLPAGKLFHVHVDDSPRLPMEAQSNEHRCFPGEGRIDVPGLLRLLLTPTRYDGYLGIELYDKRIWECDADELFQRAARSVRYLESCWAKGAS